MKKYDGQHWKKFQDPAPKTGSNLTRDLPEESRATCLDRARPSKGRGGVFEGRFEVSGGHVACLGSLLGQVADGCFELIGQASAKTQEAGGPGIACFRELNIVSDGGVAVGEEQHHRVNFGHGMRLGEEALAPPGHPVPEGLRSGGVLAQQPRHPRIHRKPAQCEGRATAACWSKIAELVEVTPFPGGSWKLLERGQDIQDQVRYLWSAAGEQRLQVAKTILMETRLDHDVKLSRR